jgi:hypothetical protein
MTLVEALLIGVGLDLALALFAVINIVSYRRHRPQRADVVVDDVREAGAYGPGQRPPIGGE